MQLTEQLLSGIVRQVERLQSSGADMGPFDDEQFSGIAGTAISDNFTYDVACWLVQRYPQQLRVEWDFDEQGRQMGVTLPRFIPLLADDSLVEADTPFLDWMANAAGGADKILPWLLQRVADTPLTQLGENVALRFVGGQHARGSWAIPRPAGLSPAEACRRSSTIGSRCFVAIRYRWLPS